MEKQLDALGNKLRRDIVEYLAHRKGATVGDILMLKPTISAPAFSRHLKMLHNADIIGVTNVGSFRRYSVNRETLAKVSGYYAELLMQIDDPS